MFHVICFFSLLLLHEDFCAIISDHSLFACLRVLHSYIDAPILNFISTDIRFKIEVWTLKWVEACGAAVIKRSIH